MGISSINKALTLITRASDTTAPTEPLISLPHDKPQFGAPASSKLDRAAPEEVGVDSLYLYSYLKELEKDRSVNLQGLMLAKDGRIFFECGIDGRDITLPRFVFSASKSVLSLAIGILCGDGLLSLSEKLSDLFSSDISAVNKLKLRDITVEDLLTMTVPADFNELMSMTDEEWTKEYLSSISPLPSKAFRYNSLNSYILSVIIKKKHPEGLMHLLSSRIFSHLGIKNCYWEQSPEGIEKGGWGLYILPEDLMKLGILTANGGMWGNKRIISEEYIALAASPIVKTSDTIGKFDYGLHIWAGRENESFLFNGMLGQNLLHFRKSGITVLSLAGNCEMFQKTSDFDIHYKYFNRSFGSALMQNKRGTEQINAYIKEMETASLPKPRKGLFSHILSSQPKEIYKISGKKFIPASDNAASAGLFPTLLQMIENCYATGIVEISFARHKDGLALNIKENDEKHTVPLSFAKYTRSVLSFGNAKYAIAAISRFSYDIDNRLRLEVKLHFLETPSTKRLTFVFEKENAVLYMSETPGKELMLNSVKAMLGESNALASAITGKLGGDVFAYSSEKMFSPVIALQQVK